jgi:hypothetical protein
VNAEVDPGAYSRRLRLLGFEPEPRDAKGVKLLLTDAACALAQQRARDFSVPEAENGQELEAAVPEMKK